MSLLLSILAWVAGAALLYAARRCREVWALLALALLLFFNGVFTPGFFRVEVRGGHLYGTPLDILNHGAQTMLLALGMSLVIATGGVDLSVGAVMAVAGALSARLSAASQPAAVCIPAALVVSTLAGAWNGWLVAVFRLQPIITTLILMVAGRGIAQLITGGQIINFDDPTLVFVGNGFVGGVPFACVLVGLVLAAAHFGTRRTALGLFIEAVGDNDEASRLAGIDARRIKFLVYTFAGFCAGLAGLVAAADIKSADANHAGLYLELDAILAVVIGGGVLTGGRFSLVGSLVGALLIQTLTTTMYARNVSAEVAPVPKALVIILACLLQSEKFRAALANLPRRLKARRASTARP